MLKGYTAVIQAGGKGSRLKKYTKGEIPKPLVMVNGKPMLQWQIDCLKEQGVENFIIIIGHLGEKIKEYFNDGSKMGISIRYIEENEPLGSAGALYYLNNYDISSDFFLVFGDVMFDIDAVKMMNFHLKNNALATLLVHPNSHPYDSDLIVMNEKNQVIRFDLKSDKRDYLYENCVNAGIYILSGKIINSFKIPQRRDLEKDILMPLLKSENVYGYRTPEYVKDAGTPERFEKVCEEQLKGLWKEKRLTNKQKCIFLDRDGTLNVYNGLINNENQLYLEKNAAEAVKLINSSGYLAIVVTNQPVVARGLCREEDVKRINSKLSVLLGEKGAYLDDIVFCPHHPDKGYPEENPEYKIKCGCRKPGTGMIEGMVVKYNIDLSESFFVGDSTVDIQTGINAGMKTVLLMTGQAGKDGKYNVKADITEEDILGAVKKILCVERKNAYD